MDNILEKIIVSVIAFIVFVMVLTNGLSNAFVTTATLDNTTFTNNNTFYNLDHSGIETAKPKALYYFGNTTFPIPSSRYSYSSSQLKIFTNGTNVCYPNITAGCYYYATYEYDTPITILGVSYLWILGLLILVFILGSIMLFKDKLGLDLHL